MAHYAGPLCVQKLEERLVAAVGYWTEAMSDISFECVVEADGFYERGRGKTFPEACRNLLINNGLENE